MLKRENKRLEGVVVTREEEAKVEVDQKGPKPDVVKEEDRFKEGTVTNVEEKEQKLNQENETVNVLNEAFQVLATANATA